jgi:hypothetical protein
MCLTMCLTIVEVWLAFDCKRQTNGCQVNTVSTAKQTDEVATLSWCYGDSMMVHCFSLLENTWSTSFPDGQTIRILCWASGELPVSHIRGSELER